MARVSLLSPLWRFVAGALVAIAVATLPTCFIALFVLPPVPLPVMIRSFLVGTALPAAVAWAILQAFRGSAEARDGMLRLRRGDLAVEAPLASVAGARAWWLPLPTPGVTLLDGTGRRLPYGLATGDPTAVLDTLAGAAADPSAARANPTVIAAATRRQRGWLAPIVKFAGLGTIPALILLYTHQRIAYGGAFGQYYLEGLGPFATTLWHYWATTVLLLVSYASCWRIAGELLVWAAAWTGEAGARRVRAAVETVCGLAYYGGVPVFLALRYLA
jgi:apolipoprotein N-acyltransferase